jgi:hypothetical protein
VPVEYPKLQAFFQLADPDGERRLRQAQDRGGACEILGRGGGDERTDLIDADTQKSTLRE